MLLLNQTGDEIVNMQNVITIRICKQTISGVELWAVNAHTFDNDQYVRLGSYKTESAAKNVCCRIINEYRHGTRTFCLWADIDDGD
jgi:hypothetical protein